MVEPVSRSTSALPLPCRRICSACWARRPNTIEQFSTRMIGARFWVLFSVATPSFACYTWRGTPRRLRLSCRPNEHRLHDVLAHHSLTYYAPSPNDSTTGGYGKTNDYCETAKNIGRPWKPTHAFASRIRGILSLCRLDVVALVVRRAVDVAYVVGAGHGVEDQGATPVEGCAPEVDELDGDRVEVRVLGLDVAGYQDVILLAVRAGVYHEPSAPRAVASVPPLVEHVVLGHRLRPLEAAYPHLPARLPARGHLL